MRHPYYESLLLIERLHRHFLEVIKLELDRLGVQDINNVQALILNNVGDDEMSVGELTARGFYLGSNVSYNVKKMVENEYLVQEPSPHDRRSSRVKLSPKGLELHKQLSEHLMKHIERMEKSGLTQEKIVAGNDMLRQLERIWTTMINYGGLQ